MNEIVNINELNERIRRESLFVDTLSSEVGKVIVGQRHLVDTLLIGLLSNGHILLEGVPGLAKTLAITTLAKAVDARFSRIQFTPDLLPADIVGTLIYSQKQEEFYVRRGPVFANFVLADEINRSPAKVQSALLEAMQERQVTIGDETYRLPEPFLVLATQNPLEQEGTYPLPEAQLDRFMFKVLVMFPGKEELRGIVEMTEGLKMPEIRSLISGEELLEVRRLISGMPIADAVMDYILELVMATHEANPYIREGASPRAAQSLIRSARARAFMEGRLNVSFEDVQKMAYPVLRHRVLLNFDAVSEGVSEDTVIRQIMETKGKNPYA